MCENVLKGAYNRYGLISGKKIQPVFRKKQAGFEKKQAVFLKKQPAFFILFPETNQ